MSKLEAVANFTIVLLFGAIAGILGVVLYLSGTTGFSAILLSLVFTILIGFAQWYFAPGIIRWITGAEEITRSQAPKIFETVARLSKKAGLPKPPKVLIVRSPVPNAFAFGRSRSDSSIALHTGLLKELSPEEAEAVIAHEIGHIKHRDVVIMTIASLIPVLLYYAAIILLSGSSDRERRNSLAVFAGGFLARFIGQFLVLWLSRVREYSADEFASGISGGRNLAKALVKISYGIGKGDTNDSVSCLYIGDNTGESPEALAKYLDLDSGALSKALEREKPSSFIEGFMSHPLTSKRILALKRIDDAK
ncbi:MAG: zinc metalloprotease HtpX [archaeon]